MISISTNNLAYRIGTLEILGNISFAIEDGDHLAIVGVNGSGKSTLLKMLCGEYEPDEGSIYIAKDKKVGMLHQDDAFNVIKIGASTGDAASDGVTSPVDETVLGQMYAVFPELVEAEMKLERLQKQLDSTPADNTELLSSLSGDYTATNNRYIRDGGLHYKSRCRSILVSLGFGEDCFNSPVSQLSGGQRTRLALARLLSREPDILILDEPTNHLDTETMEWLEGHLAAYPKNKTVILVSHDRLFLDRVTNKTLDIENCRAKLYKCSYSQYVVEKEAYRREMQKKYDLQQKEIARLEAYIEQQRRWNRERNIIAAESREKAIARMEKVEKPKEAPKAIRFSLESSGESGNDVVEIKKLTMGFGSNILFRDLSFLVKKHDRLFISGPNGCGKSTLIKILLGKLEPLSGEIEFGYNVTVGYYDQENQNLDDNNTILDELWDAYPNLTQTEIRSTLAMFLFRGDDIEKKVEVLSGGERARLTLAKLILSRMNLLILDEPTNHLDIESREALENALKSFDGTIICVSHDRYFTRQLATRFIDIGSGGLDYRGNYDQYTEYKAYLKSSQSADKNNFDEYTQSEPTQKDEYLERKKSNAERRKLEKHMKEVEREIQKLERELVDVDDFLSSDEAGVDYIRAAELYDRKIVIEDRLMQLYEEEENFSADEA
ncbi:MAG: ABC-F family ATP-binding cassette domain-containing protein [Eubacteriales bacterium]